MAGYFEASAAVPGGASIALDEVEASILRSLAVQLLELIGPGEESIEPTGADGADDRDGRGDTDEVFAGLSAGLFNEGPSAPPSDPALARLFPDAYRAPDGAGAPGEKAAEEASAEFRRFTETELRARKREDGLAVVRALDGLESGRGAGSVLTLEPGDSRQWLGALNDLRLTLASRLGITDEEDGGGLYSLPDSDPRKPMVMAYLWLGGLQETLVETLLP